MEAQTEQDPTKKFDPKKKTTTFKLTTLGELGAQLPIGMVSPDKRLLKDFELKPFRFKEEREVEKLKDKPGLSVGAFVSGLLGVLVARVHGTDIQKMADVQRRLYFGQMWFADVLYLYMYLRTQALGDVINIKIPCRHCRVPFEIDGDLKGIDVRVVDNPDQLFQKVTLKTGIPFRGELRKTFTTRPVNWLSFEDRDLNDKAMVKLAMFQNSIQSVEGIAEDQLAVLPESAFDEMTKLDTEVLTKHLEESSPGPQMTVEASCPKCKTQWAWPIDWSYESFFGASSL